MGILIRVLVIVGAYLLGSVPMGLILVRRFHGVDIREFGSGNIGATNVWRIVGPRTGLAVLVLDILKGAVPCWVMLAITHHEFAAILAGIAALVGHSLSPFLGFRGGKSVSTGLGLLLGVAPEVAGVAVVVFAVTLAATRWVSLSSILGCVAVAIAMFVFQHDLSSNVVVAAACAMIIVRHWPNIRRLIAGTEPKFGTQRIRPTDS